MSENIEKMNKTWYGDTRDELIQWLWACSCLCACVLCEAELWAEPKVWVWLLLINISLRVFSDISADIIVNSVRMKIRLWGIQKINYSNNSNS